MTDIATHGTPNPGVHPAVKGFLGKDLAGLPTWVWIAVIGGGLVLAYVVPKFLNKGAPGSSTTTGTDQTSGIGLAVDPTTGLPYAVEGLVPAGGTVGLGSNPPPVLTPPPTTTPTTPHIRMRFSDPGFQSYDTANPQGVPDYSQPGGKQIGYMPFGTAVTGQVDMVGNTAWYKMSNGQFVQYQDISTGSSTGDQPSPMPFQPAWPGDTTQTRIG